MFSFVLLTNAQNHTHRPTKERLRGYLRLSSRRHGSGGGDKEAANQKTSQLNGQIEVAKRPSECSVSTNRDSIRSSVRKTPSLVSGDSSQRREKRHPRPKSHLNRQTSNKSASNTINNSCSNITSSTYCNTDETDRSSDFPDLPTNTRNVFSDELMSVQSSMSHLVETSSNLEHDMEIIDLLERERSMNIQEMLENEKNQMHRPRDSKRGRKLPEVRPRMSIKAPVQTCSYNNGKS